MVELHFVGESSSASKRIIETGGLCISERGRYSNFANGFAAGWLPNWSFVSAPSKKSVVLPIRHLHVRAGTIA